MSARLGSPYEFCWMDLKTFDIPGTAAFLSSVLGWRFTIEEDGSRRATKVYSGSYEIGGVSDLGAPVYPPGTPPHVAYYLAVDDVDQRTEAATVAGARLVLAPFDAGDQGRMATLVDPVGAAFSLWQGRQFDGWAFPAHTIGTPLRMVLACEHPGRAERFYRDVLGEDALRLADFRSAHHTQSCDPQWELTVGVTGVTGVLDRARDLGAEPVFTSEDTGHRTLRLNTPEGLGFQVAPLPR